MNLNLRDAAETGAGLLANWGVTTQVGTNLRWNGNPANAEQDSVFKDRRLWGGLVGLAAEVAAPKNSLIQMGGGVLADGLLNSLVTTEVIRARLAKPAPAQIPGNAVPNAAPAAQGEAAFYGWSAR